MNYSDTFIKVAPDCPAQTAIVSQARGAKPTLALIHFQLIGSAPYAYTHDDVLWLGHARHKELKADEATLEARAAFFSKPQPCLRTSALAKSFGWSLHFNAEGKVALYPVQSEEYRRFASGDESRLKVIHAMRNRRTGAG